MNFQKSLNTGVEPNYNLHVITEMEYLVETYLR